VSAPSGPPLLDLRSVTVFRGERAALDRVTLRIERGEHVCILGPNGCGKSTLIKTITREVYPVYSDDSSMAILGRDRWDVSELRSKLGIVSPDLVTARSGEATGRDIVLAGLFASAHLFPNHEVTPAQVARAETALARLHIEHLAGRRFGEMSSGETKRTLIARALVHEPETLLFDEPSNALDIAAQFELTATMRALAKGGLGILLVTHHVAEIIPEIERVVMLRQGRVLLDGPKETVLTKANLESLFGVPVELTRRDGFFQIELAS
jgi:iron complex transport system ATP-binding protein